MFLNFYPSVSLSFSADFLSTDPFSSVYNTQEYLTRCLDSIVNQSYRHFELLLIDDGSRDDSGRICDDYAAKDSRIKVFHLENGGVSNARNFALNHASGEYIQFLDSDDWISPEATRLFVRTITTSQCDMVISDFYRVSGKRLSQKGDIEEDGVMTRQEFANIMLENPADFYYGVLWNKFYRREIIESVHLRMDPQISWCEDFMFNLEYVRYAETFYALRTPVYYYVKTKGSLVNQKISITKTVKMKLMMFEYYNNFYKHVLDEEDYEKNRLQVYHFLVDAAKDGFVFPASIPGNRKLGEERSSALQEVISDDGIIVDKYRDRKLLERYLESAALKHDMTMEELSLLLYLKDASHELSRKNLADLMDLSRGDLAVAVQRLSAKKMVEVTELPRRRGTERKIRLELLPASEAVIPDLEAAENDYYQAKFGNFTEEEIRQYTLLARKVRENEMSILQRG